MYQYIIIIVSDQISPPRMDSASELADYIERQVVEGALVAGERLPAIRELARRSDLAPGTVAAAIRRLVERGILVTRGRRGTFVAGEAEFVTELAVPDGLFDCASGNPDPSLLPDLGPVLARLDTEPVLYGEPGVFDALEAAARRWAGVEVDSANMAVVGGALDGVERALGAHLRPGDRVMVEAPGWPVVNDLLRAMGLEPVPVPIDDSGYLPDALEERAGSVEAIICTPRVQNPTGAAVDASRAAELGEILDRHPRMLVIEDDHAGFVAGVPLFLIGPRRPRWVLVQSASKSFGPDLRTAVLFGDPVTVRRLRARQAAGAGWVSHLLQQLLASLLDDPSTPGLLERATQVYDQRREALISALARRDLVARGRSGFNVWVEVPDEQRAVAALADAGFAVRGGDRWRQGTPPAVRITTSLLLPEHCEEMADALAAAVSVEPRPRSA